MHLPRAVRSLSVVAALLAIATLLPTSGAVAALTPPWASVTASIGACGLRGGVNLGTGDPLVVKHRRADGSLVKALTIVPSDGGWHIDCPAAVNRAGDRVEFFRGTETTPFRVFRFPTLVLRPDRAAEIVRGIATLNPDSLDVSVAACDPAGMGCETIVQATPVVASGTGAFSVPIGDLRGGDHVAAYWHKGLDEVWTGGSVGQLIITPGATAIQGRAPTPGQTVVVTLRRGTWSVSTTVKARLDATQQVTFSATLRRNGSPVTPRVGDVITADVATDAKVTVPPWFLDPSGGSLTGRCFKNAWVSVIVRDLDGRPTHTTTLTAYEDGSWSDPYAVSTDETVEADCANPRGDVLRLLPPG